jgi:hypothetical protein
LPSLHVFGSLSSEHLGGFSSEHFPLTATPVVHLVGCC